MSNYSTEGFEDFDGQQAQPAAPKGLQQGSRAAEGVTEKDPSYSTSKFGKWATDPSIGFTGAAQSWFSGANTDGPENGWATPFIDAFFEQRKAAAEEGTLGSFFDRDDATGVVTWDHTTPDTVDTENKRTYQYGDIYEGGKLQGNVYDLYDRDTANLMMSAFALSADQKKRVFDDAKTEQPGDKSLRNKELDDLLLEQRAEDEVNLPKAFKAMAFEKDVDAREKELTEGSAWNMGSDESIVAGAAAGAGSLGLAGGAAGAGFFGVGAVVGGVGGAIIGGVAGGVGAWLNKDSLTEQAARAFEITEQSREQFGADAGFATGVHQASKFGMKLISPASNLVQGTVDAYGKSSVGDGQADFYKVDDKGERTTSKWVIGADMAATVGDSVLQFATPLGLAAYSGLMTGTVGGQVTELAATGGSTFDDRSGSFDNIFYDTDKDGNRSFDPASAAAGIASIGIDAVQLGFARGLAGKTDEARTALGLGSTYGTGNAAATAIAARMPRFLGGQSDAAAARAAAAAGGTTTRRQGGFEYLLDAGGTAVSRRVTLSLLAPSEQLASLSAKVMARRHLARAQGAVSTDDIYRAAAAMSSGERKWTNTIVNAMGESYEEGAQAALEPISHDANLDAQEIYMAAAYGFAAGAGMGAGAAMTAPTPRMILENQAQVAYRLNSGGAEMDAAALKAMDEDALRVLAGSMSPAQRELARSASQKARDELVATNVAGVAGEARLRDAINTARDANLAKANPRVDGSFVVTPLEAAGEVDADGKTAFGSIPSDAIVSSASQMLTNMVKMKEGLDVQVEALTAELTRPEIAADPDALAKAGIDAQQATEMQAKLAQVIEEVDVRVGQINTELDPIVRAANVASLNEQLRSWYTESDATFGGEVLDAAGKRALARAVSMVYARDPHDSSGSYPMLVPQVSLQLTVDQADNVIQVSSGILKAIRGDHDGDKLRPQNMLWLDEDAFANARSGAWYVGTGSAVHVDPPKEERYNVESMSDALQGTNIALRAEALAAMTDIGTLVKKRYAGRGVDTAINRVIEDFYTAIRANVKDARAILLDGLAGTGTGSIINERARENLSNEWLWLDQVVRAKLQKFQEVAVAHRPSPQREVDDLGLTVDDAPTGLYQSRSVKERIGRRAATFGNTMALLLMGDSPFRMFQKLHYSSENSPVLSADTVEQDQLLALSQMYEMAGQQMTQSELERIQNGDPITGSVLVALDRMAADAVTQSALAASSGFEVGGQRARALSKHEALVVMANMEVRDFEQLEDGTFRPLGVISLTQALLKQAVARDRREKARILEAAPALKAKHFRLDELTKPGGGNKNSPVNAEKAFVEVFGGESLASLLGEEAAIFGPQLTLEQAIRQFEALSPAERALRKTEITKGNPGYLGRKSRKNIPYSVAELYETDATTKITPSRAVIDVLLAVGQARDAENAERSDRVSTQFTEGHATVRKVMGEMLQINPKKGELTVELVSRILRENPAFAQRAFDLIPKDQAQVSFEVRNGEVYVNNWFFEMFSEPDAAKAEMIFYRGTLMDSWRATGVQPETSTSDAREYDSLKRRMHRVLYRSTPTKAQDGGIRWAALMQALYNSESVADFIGWVNNPRSGLLFKEAPITAWIDDVAEFDVDKANGGWTTSLQGAELREAIKVLKESADLLLTEVIEERAIEQDDRRLISEIEQVIALKKGNAGRTLDPNVTAMYDAFEAAIDRAGELAVALGPHAMVFQTTANAWGFYGQAHNKGKNPAHVEALGMFDARRDAFGFVHNYSRVMGSLTALDIDSVGANLNLVAKDGGRAMDDYGNIVEWGKPTVEQMVELLKNPETKSYARALLQPTVLERTDAGQLSEQMLLGKTLRSLLDGSTYDELFGKYENLDQPAAFKYLSLLEAQAREFGGHSAVQRAVNDIVIARIQGARSTLDFSDVESMTTEAYYQVALVMQKVGALEFIGRAQDTDLLDEVRTSVKHNRRDAHKRGRLGELGTMGEAEVDAFQTSMQLQHDKDVADLTGNLAKIKDPNLRQIALDRITRLNAEHELFLEQWQTLKDGDEVGYVVAAHAIPKAGILDPVELDKRQSAVKANLVKFVDDFPSIVDRVPGALMEITKLQRQLGDAKNYNRVILTDPEWDTVSRAVIGMQLADSAGPVGQGVSVRLAPDAKSESDYRYYDQSYSYLVDKLLSGPLVKAAAKIHVLAKRHAVEQTEDDLAYEIERTIFDEKKLGPWTEEVVTFSVESNQRIDSAAAAQAVAISGTSPKAEATVSAATARTFVVPGDELLSTVTLTSEALEQGIFDELAVAMPDGTSKFTPLAMLNNRFARSVTATLPDGTVVDLIAENPDLGRTWYGNARQAPANTGLYEVHTDRIAEAMVNTAARYNVAAGDLQVEMRFFHPEAQPALPEFYNNLWFVGTSFKLDADRHSSINDTLWFSLGSLSPEGQAAALDAAKTGKQAMQVIKTPSAADRAADELGFESDLTAVIRKKTRRIMETDLGFGALEIEMYNAVYAAVKLRHFLIVGEEVLTAEDVIARQAAGETFPDAQLWTPSDKVLRTMLGEQGGQGVPRVLDGNVEFDTSRVAPYQGITPAMMETFAEGLTGGRKELHETRIVHRGRQSALRVRPMMSRRTRDEFAERFSRMAKKANEGHFDRSQINQKDGGFPAGKNLQRAVAKAGKMLNTENLSFMYEALGIPFIGPRIPSSTELSKMLLRDLAKATEANDRRTGWILTSGTTNSWADGTLGEVPIEEGPERPGLRILLGDLVVVDLASFGDGEKASDTAKEQIRRLADKGATVVLGEADGGSDLRGEMSAYIRSLRYEPIAGSKHAFKPPESNSWYIQQQAREDTLMEVKGISGENRVLVFNAEGIPMQEGGAHAVTRNKAALGAVKVISDLVPTSSMGGFGVPQFSTRNQDQVSLVIAHLQGLNNPTDVAHLKEISQSQNDPTFDRAWQRMMERFEDPTGGVLPKRGERFEIGDMIPLIDNGGRVVLYRHGHERPKMQDRIKQFDSVFPGKGDGGQNVAVYSPKIEEAASTHSGDVVEFKARAGYGLSVEMNVPLQLFGDKKQLQFDGTKYTMVPEADPNQPNAPVLPQHTIMRNRDIAIISDLDTRLGKQGTESMVNNHRNAFAYFGMDFTTDVTDFFFPGQGDNAKARQATKAILRYYSNVAEPLSVRQAHEILNAERLNSRYLDQLPEIANSLAAQQGVDASWTTRLDNPADPQAQIVSAMLVYLSVHGTRLEDVLKTGSMDDTTAGPDAQSIGMPQLFTQIFDNARIGSPLRVEINRRINAAINRRGALPGEDYRLMQDFTMEIHAMHNGEKRVMYGRLSFPEVHSSGDNPVTNGMSFQDGTRQQASVHSALVADEAIGGRTLTQRGLEKAQAFKDAAFNRNDRVERFEPGAYDDGAVWRVLTDVPAVDRSQLAGWSMPLPAEIERRGLAHDAMVSYRKPIEQGDRWSPVEKADAKVLVGDILTLLNLPRKMAPIVDGWVRQMSGRAAGMTLDGVEMEPLSGSKTLEWLRLILDNVASGETPVMGGYVPLLHVHDLRLIYRHNQDPPRPWAPVLNAEDGGTKAGRWDDWVHASLGSGLASEKTFDAYYLLPTDGFMHTYQHATDSLADLPVSMDVLVQRRVLSMAANELTSGLAQAETANDHFMNPNYQAVASIDPRTSALVSSPMVLDTARMTLGDMLGGQRIDGEYRGEAPPASAKGQQDARLKRNAAKTGRPTGVPKSMKDYRQNSTIFLHHTGTNNALTRGLINLRVGNALLNPALYVSMPIELMVRASLDTISNTLAGQATSGPLAMAQAKLSQKIGETERGAQLQDAFGSAQYTPEQLKQLKELYHAMGANPDFKAMVYGDLMFQRPYEPGKGRIDRMLEGYAKLGSKAQDPTYGMRADSLGRRYLEPALQHIIRSGTLSAFSIDQIINNLQMDPRWLEKHMPSAHKAGTNNIAQIRSLKATPLTLALRWVYEPLSQNPNPGLNMFGNLVLRMPMLFAGYAGNVATTILGLQGASDLTAAFLDGRKKGPKHIFGRISASMRGDSFTPEQDAEFDMSSVLEGIDLARSFMRGGLTHTGLFTFAMMAGGLGLSGEDDEAKRMRRAAALQGGAHVYDPRDIVNDFRNADAIYLDQLPFGIAEYFKNDSGRAMANTHWMMKQFISPIVGIEKFIETGNFNHVKWGFLDALGAFPLINTNTISDTIETMATFEKQASDLALEGTDEANVKAMGLLTSIVGSYEKMLFEQSFISGLYVNADLVDRDPYAKVMTDAEGNIMRDALGFPRQTEKLEDFVDPKTGEAMTGYQSRPDSSAALATLTENRFTMMLVSSLFTGLGDSEYNRFNMVPKIREIEKNQVDKAMAEAMIFAAYGGKSGMRNISEDEGYKIALAQAKASGVFVQPEVLQAQARMISAQSGGAAMSRVEGAKEYLTEEGAKGIFRGLFKGTLDFGDDKLKGFYITPEVREEIMNDWVKELTAEGVSMGLETYQAEMRTKRLMNGSFSNPTGTTGLADILFDYDKISGSDKTEFYQLNTTYVMGPDGRPWATGYDRPSSKSPVGVLQQIGVLPLSKMQGPATGAVGQDASLNTVDKLAGINTGLRSLMQRPDVVPTPEEIGKMVEKAIKDAGKTDYTPFTPTAKSSGGGYGYTPWKKYGGYKRGSYGGGGYSSSGYPNFTRMYTMPEGESPYGNSVPFINTSNPILRRGDVRRERVWSERGRLNQWQ